MPNYYQNPNIFTAEGYEFHFTRFADSIINDHFDQARAELDDILTNFRIHERQILAGGGGLSSITQALGSRLSEIGWKKRNIESSHHVGGRILTSESHEVDHYKSFERGNIGLEIEWNNKDPFYDRDLENFRKLHQIGELSLGIIITRGASLQRQLYEVYLRYLQALPELTFESISHGLPNLSDAAKADVRRLLVLPHAEATQKIAANLYSSKYGAATTHMNKLLLRLERGVGNPCPFILIGIGEERLDRHGTIQ